MIFEGALSTKAILEEQKREINCLYLQENKHSKDINYILHLCHKFNVEVKRISKEEIDQMTIGHTHGGIVIEAFERKQEELSIEEDFYLLLEGIEDPFNLGQIMRTAYIAGVKTVLLSARDYEPMANTILKSSAGCSEHLKWIICDESYQNLIQLKQGKIQIVSAKRDVVSIPMTRADFTQPICICIGGEKRGLSQRVIELSDVFVEIKYPTNARVALSASSSSAVLCFEVVRQRMEN